MAEYDYFFNRARPQIYKPPSITTRAMLIPKSIKTYS